MKKEHGSTWRQTVESEFVLDASARLIVEQIERLIDELARMEQRIDADGMLIVGGNGNMTAHPLLATSRQHRLAIEKLVARLGLAEDTPGQRQARKAANARWDRQPSSARPRKTNGSRADAADRTFVPAAVK